MRESIKLSREIFAQKAFDEYRDIEIQPGDKVQSDAELDAFVRKYSDSAYHPSCTCRMGNPSDDKTTVVDYDGKVLGEKHCRACPSEDILVNVSNFRSGRTSCCGRLRNAPSCERQLERANDHDC